MHHLKRVSMALALFFLMTFIFLSGWMDDPDYLLQDAAYTSYRQLHPNIFVIGIDSATLDHYGPWGSWSREVTADFIRYLNEEESSKPAVIGIDILFSGNTSPDEDNALAEAAKEGGNVVVASQAFFAKELLQTETQPVWNYSNIQNYEECFPTLASVAPAGLINIFADSDGIVRRGVYEYHYQDQTLTSFAAQVANVFSQRTGTPLPPPPILDASDRWTIPFAAKPGEFYGTGGMGTSWIRVMNGEIPRELFADSIVLVGPYSTGMLDNFYTSADRSTPMYGIEIHANALQALLEGQYKYPTPGYFSIALIFILSSLLYFLFSRWGVRICTIGAVSICALYVLASMLIFRQAGWILPLFYPLVTWGIVYLSLLITNYMVLTAEKAGLYDQMQNLFVNSIRMVANAIDAKDPCTSGHCQRVSEYSLLLGKDLGFSQESLADLEYSALLHDVGKIGVSDSVLKKTGPLTDDEYAEMKTHPARGAQILETIQEFRNHITEGAKYHHERYDGRGYCEGLSGAEIPLFGRIIAIADSYDAMTQNRPYHRRMSRNNAIEEIRKGAGTQFDPELAQRFIRLLEQMPEPVECAPIPPVQTLDQTIPNYSNST